VPPLSVALFNGYLAKYIGDGLLVYFGYPLAHEDDAQRVVRVGLGCGNNKARRMKPGRCWLRFTAGSLKDLIPRICKKQRGCWKNSDDSLSDLLALRAHRDRKESDHFYLPYGSEMPHINCQQREVFLPGSRGDQSIRGMRLQVSILLQQLRKPCRNLVVQIDGESD
jgi:hypothetical protein